jgi:signal peptidase I
MSAPQPQTTPPPQSWLRWSVARILGQSKKPTTNPRDSFREGLETVVFVVVLVFMLKQFVVEAFVIPTGSMAETLYGYRKALTCPECGHEFQLNSSREVEPQDGMASQRIQGYCCPNCRHKQAFTGISQPPYTKSFLDRIFGPGNTSGDRVLVHKAVFHKYPAQPGDVVVFKYPDKPQKDYSAQNYIKRMWATGGQTLAIWRGDLYVCESLKYPADAVDDRGEPLYERPESDLDLWKQRYTHHNAPAAVRKFEESRAAGFPDNGDGFKLIRKTPKLIEEMKRIVYDNDHQNKSLKEKGVPPRWKADADDWAADGEGRTFAHSGANLGWLRYRHIVVEDARGSGRPAFSQGVIENFLGYNGETDLDQNGNYRYTLGHMSDDHKYWVGDLLVECSATFENAAEVVLELSKGPNRFQALFKDNRVRLFRTGPGAKEMAGAPAELGGGAHALRFANIDSRLHVWVDGRHIEFGADADYFPAVPETFDRADPKEEGFTKANDIDAPVSIGARGGASVKNLKIWRDTYYVRITPSYQQARFVSSTTSADTYFAPPGHYFCLGDNSAQSSDSRVWGTVPERLMLGKAMFIFWPGDRIGFIK